MATQALFGSGRLLKDLLEYDPNGKFIFIGDACQLPPVQQKISPALSIEYFKNVFDIEAEEVELTDIVRQREGNDLILASQRLRKLYHNPPEIKWAKFPFKGYKNIELLSSQAELIGRYIEDVKSKGFNYSSILCYSNKQCDMLTRLLRPMLGIYSQQLAAGDLLLVTQNNNLSGLMNGDVVTVQQVVVKEQRAGLTFLKVSVKELFTGKEYSQLMIADVLYGNQTNLTQSQQKELFIDFYIRMKHQGLRQKDDAFKSMMIKDPYLNALRAVFGYALTCHKAQGGEWEHIYLDVPRNFPLVEKPYVYQWMYTAMTRAKYKMFTINDFWVE
jgi:cell division inhibitor SulA